MKKIALIISLVLLLILAGCGEKEDKVAKYVEKNQNIEEICSNTYISCELTARDGSVVLSLTANDVDNADETSKAFFDDMMKDMEMQKLFEKMKKEERSIKSLIIEFCETDGDVVASYEYK